MGMASDATATMTASPQATSARPTTPLTASVRIAADTKKTPAAQARCRLRVSRNKHPASTAATRPCKSTLTQWQRNGESALGDLPRARSFVVTSHVARQIRFGIGRYEPIVASGGRPQKST